MLLSVPVMDEAAKTVSSIWSSDNRALLLSAGMALPAAALPEQAVRANARVSASSMESLLLFILTTPILSAAIAAGAITAAHEDCSCCDGAVKCKYTEAAVAWGEGLPVYSVIERNAFRGEVNAHRNYNH